MAEDSGTTRHDMKIIRERTRFVAGVTGDPSPFTAQGAFQGIRAAVRFRYGLDDLEGIRVAIQGVGNVDRYLAKLLHHAGATLWVTDVSNRRLSRVTDELGANSVAPDAILDQEVDVFAPCGMANSCISAASCTCPTT